MVFGLLRVPLSRRFLASLSFTLALATFFPAAFAEELPKGLKWQSNETDPVYGSPQAKKGGVFRSYLAEFPVTLRPVGPDANGEFANNLVYSTWLPLVDRHPNTNKTIGILAREWAFGADGKTVFFRLRPNAKWSDGQPFTAADVAFTLDMFRLKEIQDPTANQLANEEFDKVIVYDPLTLAIVSKRPRTNLDYWMGTVLYPLLPRHFLQGKVDKDFVKNFNWTVIPGTGPYLVSAVEKGKRVRMKRVDNWWGAKERYFQNRFNVDEVDYKLFRDEEVAFEAFKKGDLEHYWITRPVWWHDKTKDENFTKGYIHKLWFYNDQPQQQNGFFLNTRAPIFADVNVRHAFAHALNIDLVTKQLIYGDYERMNEIFEGYGPGSSAGIKARSFAPEKVKELMEKSGWKRGADGIWAKGNERFSVGVTVAKGPQIEKRLEVLREEAKKAGLDLRIQAMDGAAAWKAAREKKFEATYLPLTASLFPDPKQILDSKLVGPNTNNFFEIADPELDKLLGEYGSAKDLATEARLIKGINARVNELGIFVGSWSLPFTREAYWRWVVFPEPAGTKRSDYLTLYQNHYLYGGMFWMDPDLKKETDAAKAAGKTFSPVTRIDTTYKKK